MKDSHTTRNSSTICAGVRETQGLSSGLREPPSQSSKSRLRDALRVSHHGLVAAALGALLVLSACTPSPPGTGATTPPGSSSGASSSAPTPAITTPAPTTVAAYQPATAEGPAQNVPVPVLPEKAKEFSKEGLIAFAEYWYSTLGYVFETGDSKPMMAVSVPTCQTCANINGPVSRWYVNGGWIVGGLMTVHSSASTFEKDADGNHQAVLTIQQSPISYYEADLSLYKSYPPTIARPDIVVATYSDGHWTTQTAEHLTKE